MYPSLVLSAALVAPAAPVPRDTAPNTSGPAPRVIALKADATGTVRIVGSIPTILRQLDPLTTSPLRWPITL